MKKLLAKAEEVTRVITTLAPVIGIVGMIAGSIMKDDAMIYGFGGLVPLPLILRNDRSERND